ncbi:MAG TPA: dihydropyrimidinase [Pantanalinema sp.]
MGTLIKHGEIVTATERMRADVYVEDGTIQAIASRLDARPGDTVIDAGGCYVFPGGIDVHTHLDMPFMGTVSTDDFETGTRAAAVGGTTGVIDFVMPEKGQPLMDALSVWHAKARGRAVSDYAFHMAVTHYSDAVGRELPRVVEAGVTSFKTFMAYKGSIGIDDAGLFQVMRKTRDLGALVTVHAENAEVVDGLVRELVAEGKLHPRYHALSRPALAEAEATHRAIALAEINDRSLYIVHLTCDEALAHVKHAHCRGRHVMAETCPQYLLLDDSRYDEPDFEGAKYVMSPPLRKPKDNEALWQALAAGYIQTVATDHCPFDFEGAKQMGRDDFSKIPNGAPGIEDRLALLYTYGVVPGRISLNRFVEVFATNPARIFGLHPRKGTVCVGADADLVVFDPTIKGRISAKTHHQRVDYNPFEGFETIGAPTHVLINGRVAVEGGKYVGEPGTGRYLPRSPVTPLQKSEALRAR